jgi:dipeptidyl aminopeptidase/acylaminoacyl peptidase
LENSNHDSELFLLDLRAEGALPVPITRHENPVQHYVYGFSPDSSRLLYGTDAYSEFVQGWSYQLASGEHSPLVQADWDVSFIFYSDSGDYRVTGINRDASLVVEVLDTKTGLPLRVPEPPFWQMSQLRFSPREKQLAFLLSSDTSPGDVYVVDLKTQLDTRLTEALNPAIAESELVRSQVVRFSSFDGLEIPGILFKPVGASTQTPAPALVWVHGGPGGQSKTNYSATWQHLLNHGYAILAVNNRGSSGYGKTFFHLDDQRHGEVDLDDVVFAKRYLAGLDWVDPGRIGIIGGSYGGYMVGAALAFRPGVFRCLFTRWQASGFGKRGPDYQALGHGYRKRTAHAQGPL